MTRNELIQAIKDGFTEIHESHEITEPLPELHDDMILLEAGLDSLGFAILVTMLEDRLGYDPFTLSEEAYYPQTFGQFVDYYFEHAPR